ncbi:DEAD/DEAH box helicase family protein [Oculatella sp. LEGE 06141]|uniref:DEAD/DEAH box helicase n=1 Tax=Oculatella sp. LEGE 06141 TaxID=1828648 RepID=UPI001882C1BE|nr:DEAD/DEAH box helicase family protein [Oculatella sp. LEGE 06141]MBE9181214.1 DEAD/DEAH box helicase family protein [Oculatella sp. LEGE 06141]
MGRTPTLKFDRGTLVLHPPPKGKSWVEYATWDDRVEKFRIPAIQYRELVETLQTEGTTFTDEAKAFDAIALKASLERQPYAHQQEALDAWVSAGRKGVVVLPTAAGKTYLAQMAMQVTPRSTLITVPTLDLMHQWYAHLLAAFPDADVGLLGGGSRDRTQILIATYDSAAIHAESLGNRYALLICDECHHLPSDFNRVIAEYAIAPYRLGLTATPDRSDGRHADLDTLLGSVVYYRTASDLAGGALADHEIVQIKVKLSQQERDRYDALIQTRNAFLQQSNIFLGSLQGWQRFVQASAQSQAGRRAMLAHREAKAIALGTEGKLRVLADVLAQHYPEQTLIFTNDNATVYRISQDFLIPALTHQTPVKERHEILQHFRDGTYNALVASHVLNEGVDVPEASVAVLLSGTGSAREYIQRLGRVLRKGKNQKFALLYEVVAEETTEEQVSRRRRQPQSDRPRSSGQLELIPTRSPYDVATPQPYRAADTVADWLAESSSDTISPDSISDKEEEN